MYGEKCSSCGKEYHPYLPMKQRGGTTEDGVCCATLLYPCPYCEAIQKVHLIFAFTPVDPLPKSRRTFFPEMEE